MLTEYFQSLLRLKIERLCEAVSFNFILIECLVDISSFSCKLLVVYRGDDCFRWKKTTQNKVLESQPSILLNNRSMVRIEWIKLILFSSPKKNPRSFLSLPFHLFFLEESCIFFNQPPPNSQAIEIFCYILVVYLASGPGIRKRSGFCV